VNQPFLPATGAELSAASLFDPKAVRYQSSRSTDETKEVTEKKQQGNQMLTLRPHGVLLLDLKKLIEVIQGARSSAVKESVSYPSAYNTDFVELA